MRLILCLLVFTSQVFADVYSVVVVPGTTNITATYNTTNKVATGFRTIQDIVVDNPHATARYYVTCNTAGLPDDASTHFFQVGPGGTLAKTNANVGGTCYFKSSSGTISSGSSLFLTFWGY